STGAYGYFIVLNCDKLLNSTYNFNNLLQCPTPFQLPTLFKLLTTSISTFNYLKGSK
ncbi:22665_t:CDS:1, partial [Gigaspora rosea]